MSTLGAVVRAALAVGAVCAVALAAAPAAMASQVTLRYGWQEHEDLTVFPAAEAGSTAVILIHEGGWHEQKQLVELESQALALQAHGFTVFDINYPLDSVLQPAFAMEPAAVVRAIQWAKKNGLNYNADPSNVVLLGGSAGGHLAAMAASMTPVQAVVSLSGPMNLNSLVEMGQREELYSGLRMSLARALGCMFTKLMGCSQAFAEEWSPASHPTCVPFLLYGSETDIVPFSQQQEMQQSLRASGCPVTVVQTPRGHAFAYWARIRGEVFDFIDAH